VVAVDRKAVVGHKAVVAGHKAVVVASKAPVGNKALESRKALVVSKALEPLDHIKKAIDKSARKAPVVSKALEPRKALVVSKALEPRKALVVSKGPALRRGKVLNLAANPHQAANPLPERVPVRVCRWKSVVPRITPLFRVLPTLGLHGKFWIQKVNR